MIYLDMDAFFASVEQRDHPHLRGRPTLVCHTDHDPESTNFGVVAAASYEARPYGVRSGITVLEARKKLGRDAAFIRADYQKYLAVCRGVYRLCEGLGYTEAASVDEFFIEAINPQRRFGFELFAAADLQRAVRERFDLSATVGVGYSKRSSKMIAETVKPGGVAEVCSREDFLERFRNEPVTVIPGVAKRLSRSLSTLGIYTIADLAEADPLKLVKRFGVNGWSLSRAGRGEGGGRLDPGFKRRRVRSVGHSASLRRVSDLRELKTNLLGLAEGVARRLRAQGLEGRTVTTWICFDRTFSKREGKTLDRPVSLGGPIHETACKTLDKFAHLVKPWPASAIGVRVSNLRNGMQLSFDEDRDLRLALACDAIEKRFGARAVQRSSLVNWRREYHAVPRTEVS